MQSELIESVRALAEAQKNCWASKWPSERVSDTVLGADTRRMVDDGSEEGACEGGLDPVAEGDKTTLDFLEAALHSPLPALLAALERAEQLLERAQSICIDALGSSYGLTPAIEEDMRRLNTDIVAHRKETK